MKEIPLTGGGVTIVDDADYESLSRYKWHTIKSHNSRYVSRMTLTADGKWKRLLMHREIVGAPKGKEVDHEDGDTFNNLRSNLRLATYKQNMANLHRVRVGASGYRGVYPNGSGWRAVVNGVSHGTFTTPEEAARVRDQHAISIYGQFAYLNFPIGMVA